MKPLTLASATLALLASASLAHAQFTIPWSTVDCGGGTVNGGPFQVSGTIGQPDAVQSLTGGSFTITGGFWPVSIPTGPSCDSIDFNNDGGSFDPQDIDAFLSVFSEGPCIPDTATCNDIDFNNDGALFDPCDIDAFLLLFSEGPCTLCGA
jgi:hypothetical protein